MAEFMKVISAVRVVCDEFEFGVIPGSLEFKEGYPVRVVKGIDNGDQTWAEDFTENFGVIKFDAPTVNLYLANARTLSTRAGSTIKFFDDAGTQRVMKSGVLKNDQSNTVGSDGKISLEFSGTPLN